MGIQASTGETPLTVAAEAGKAGVVAVLLRAGADPNKRDKVGDYNALYLAGFSNHVSTVRALLDAGAKANSSVDGTTVLANAAYDGLLGLVQMLLEAGADPLRRSDGELPATIAEENGHADVVALLL